MNLSRILYRMGIINHKIEFLFILTWTLFFPLKESQIYFLGFAFLMCLISLKNIYFMKTIGLSYFSHFLMVFNFILILSVFLSNYPFKSILLLADILLISCYFTLFYYDRRMANDYFHLIGRIISVFSFINVILYVVPLFKQDHIFFVSSIHEGIISGIGALIFFYYLLKKWNPRLFILIILNLGGVFVSESKAAYIGTVIFFLLLILLKKKILIPFLLLFVILTFIIPNPIRSMFYHSLKKDPYALNRIDIWQMSLTIFKDHLLFGVGLDNFSEVSGKYNFKQTRGPANYFKVPRIPHSDYLKLMTELGLLGLVIILALFYFLAKKIFSASLFNVSNILLFYLLFQALLFNILFNFFFFFIFLFLLKNILEREQDITFRSFSSKFKLFLSSLLVFIWMIGYLFPCLSGIFIEKAKKSTHPVQVLRKAGYLNPLDQQVYYLKAFYLYHDFKQASNLESFYNALANLRKTHRLNPYYIDAYLLEFELYLELLNKKIKYISMEKEILAPLEKAEGYAPVDPFIKLAKARIYFEFNQDDRAKQEAIKAIALEPEYVAALYFLQKKFNYFQDEKAFQQEIEKILKKARELNPERGHYLYKLYEIPGKYNQEGKHQ
ncbi:MAG: O-antigen ligase family protein [Candidatus Aminicenantes bacterium]|nr:MAG: O-antigen ligase family protein [Candidatus Aminicenantes bacterium]